MPKYGPMTVFWMLGILLIFSNLALGSRIDVLEQRIDSMSGLHK